MIKVDIVNEVSRTAEITKVKAELAVDAVFDAMRMSMQRGERIELRGFGVFQVKPRKRGIGRNPRTGKEVRIPPGRTDPVQARQGPAEHRRVDGGPISWSPDLRDVTRRDDPSLLSLYRRSALRESIPIRGAPLPLQAPGAAGCTFCSSC